MKIAIYIEDGLTQLVLTPTDQHEHSALSLLHSADKEVTTRRGTFYACQGGWTRQSDGDESTILIITDKKQPEPNT